MSQEMLSPPRVSFPVADVAPVESLLEEVTLDESLSRRLGRSLLSCPQRAASVVEAANFHPLIAAAALAYKRHHPLVLFPDAIWVTILQGVAQHVSLHAETLRERLVRHRTRLELVVRVSFSDLPQQDAEMLLVGRSFAGRIAQYVLPEKRFLFETRFSTTNAASEIAMQVSLMDAFQLYFDYHLVLGCGIPSVTLEGTPEDWEMLGAQVERLHESDLELSWWTDHLRPLCAQFVRAARGDVDVAHWGDLCKLTKRYGEDDLNGWLLKFIPYVRKSRHEPFRQRNPVLELETYPELSEVGRFDPITGCTSEMLPTGIARAPVTYQRTGSARVDRCEFVAGLAGVEQDPHDLSLRPRLGWAICEGAAIEQLLSCLRTQHEAEAPAEVDARSLLERFDGYCPSDLIRFYHEMNGATVCTGAGENIRILPWKKIVACCSERALRAAPATSSGELSSFDDEIAARQSASAARGFARLRRIAESKRGAYVFGRDPLASHGNESRGEVFLWTGEPEVSAFTPVACSFSDWLALLLV